LLLLGFHINLKILRFVLGIGVVHSFKLNLLFLKVLLLLKMLSGFRDIEVLSLLFIPFVTIFVPIKFLLPLFSDDLFKVGNWFWLIGLVIVCSLTIEIILGFPWALIVLPFLLIILLLLSLSFLPLPRQIEVKGDEGHYGYETKQEET
jgi:hypothetical protein